MTLWARCRKATTTLPAACVAAFVLVLLMGGTAVPLPALTLGGSATVQLSQFVPVVMAAVLALCLDTRVPAAEASGIRKIRRLDAALIVGVIALLTLVGVLTALVFEEAFTHPLWTLGRNTACAAGLLLLARPQLGRAAVMVPVAMVFGVVLFGYRMPTDPYPWGFILEPATSPLAAVACAVIAAAGVITHVLAAQKEEL
ncbi:hypothetical protein [Streptomyces sp. BV129]|uniref:hypothetical protein n=1 Tax=Streptomyces sp. BV129 TaxID=2849671 RepID=UPI001C2ECDE1|nr:hypothetical protein [Streptomyces sp. BV129]MBV1946975.1 hypothetical protein [Streptomyces sp. BV129]